MAGRRSAKKTPEGEEERPEFVSTEAKDRVRFVLDRAVIEAFRKAHFPDDGLAFLGLTGEHLNDLLSWREFVSRWTAVQAANTEDEQEVFDELERRVLKNNLERQGQLLKADVDELLVASKDKTRLRWPYHLVNLDYSGGLINARDDGSAKRLDAIRSLYTLQEGTPFVLFLTVSFRGDDGGEMLRVIQQQEDDLTSLGRSGVAENFTEHRDLGRPGQLKIYVPIFLAGVAPRHRLRFPLILRYPGTVPMMHFAVECIPYVETAANRQLTTMERIDILNRPLTMLLPDCSEDVTLFTQIT